jgi:hypothetical protein
MVHVSVTERLRGSLTQAPCGGMLACMNVAAKVLPPATVGLEPFDV